jgi:hypothetical protein
MGTMTVFSTYCTPPQASAAPPQPPHEAAAPPPQDPQDAAHGVPQQFPHASASPGTSAMATPKINNLRKSILCSLHQRSTKQSQ